MTNREAIVAFYGKALTVNTETTPTEVLTPILSDDFKVCDINTFK